MGDRSNILVLDYTSTKENPGVFLYSHWLGKGIALAAQKALARKERWGDGPYLTRIIADELSLLVGEGKNTGMGISTRILDNEHPILVVDTRTQSMWLQDELTCQPGSADLVPPMDAVSFMYVSETYS